MTNAVRILNASLEDDEATNQIIIRGTVDQTTLGFIDMAWYQRERGFSTKHTTAIMSALFAGSKVADITIGMRGQRVRSKKGDKGEEYLLLDKCFCIDGGQRLYGAALALRQRSDLKVSLGVKAYLGTTEDFENDLFCRLGTTQVRIAPSILLRNRKKKSPAAALMLAMNDRTDFALKDRIGWDQRKTPHELMTGLTFARIVGALHAHKAANLKSSKGFELLAGLDALHETIGPEFLATNIVRFFDAIDKCWTIRHLNGGRSESRPHLNPTFLMCLAGLFSKHEVFWDGTERSEFYCGDKYVRALRKFPLAKYMTAQTRTLMPKKALYQVLRDQLHLEPTVQPFTQAAE